METYIYTHLLQGNYTYTHLLPENYTYTHLLPENYTHPHLLSREIHVLRPGDIKRPGSVRAARSGFLEMNPQTRLVRKFFMPIGATIFLCVLGFFVVRPRLPHGASRDEWVAFLTTYVRDFDKNKNDFVVIVSLLFLQTVHTLMCIPFINVTQTVIGFLYGWWQGGLLSGSWECVVLALFVCVAPRQWRRRPPVPAEHACFVQQLVAFLRGKRILYPFILVTQMSSIPINSTVLLIADNAVMSGEYLCIHFAVSGFNAVKNTFIGFRIRQSSTELETWRLGEIMLFVVIWPSVLSLALACAVLTFYNKLYRRPANLEQQERGGPVSAAATHSLVAPYTHSLVSIFRHHEMTRTDSAEELKGLMQDTPVLESSVSSTDRDNPVWAFETTSNTLCNLTAMASLYTGDNTPSCRAHNAHLTDYSTLPRAHTSPYLDPIECGEEDLEQEAETQASYLPQAGETSNTGVANAAMEMSPALLAEMTASIHIEMAAGVYNEQTAGVRQGVEAHTGPVA